MGRVFFLPSADQSQFVYWTSSPLDDGSIENAVSYYYMSTFGTFGSDIPNRNNEYPIRAVAQ